MSGKIGHFFKSLTTRAPYGSPATAQIFADIVHVHDFFPLLSPSIFDACQDAGVPSGRPATISDYSSPGALLHPDEWHEPKAARSFLLVSPFPKRVSTEFDDRDASP